MNVISKLGGLASFGVAMSVLLAAPVLGEQHLSQRGYENVQTLKEAVEMVRSQVSLDGKPEFAALITEERVREAVRSAIRDIDGRFENVGKRLASRKDEWQNEIKPVCLKMADEGHWPAGSSFNGFYVLKEANENGHDGLGLRLNIVTPKATFNALPIADVWFGRAR